MRFVPENRDFKLWRMFQDLLDASNACHAVSDNHEFLHHRAAFCSIA
jgi:hypothetical protein